MPVSNTVEAVLRSRYDDGVAKGIDQTEKVLRAGFAGMQNATVGFVSAFGSIWETALGWLRNFRLQLNQTADHSENQFKKMGLIVTAFAVLAAEAFLRIAKAAASFFLDLIKESSKLTEMKLAYEALTKATGFQVDTLSKLKKATEGLVGSTDLLRNVNRVMQSGIPITSQQYIKLAENVARLARAAGGEGKEALDMLTDSLIRGSARGLQQVGIYVQVKDAVSEMARMTGQAAGSMEENSRRQVYYNELLRATSAAVAKLPPDFLTLEDLLNRTDRSWKGYLLSIGEAINRSPVLQGILKRLSSTLDDLSLMGPEQMRNLTLQVNQFFLSTIQGCATVLDTLGVFSIGWQVLWRSVATVVNATGGIVTGVLYLILKALLATIEVSMKLNPGMALLMRMGDQVAALRTAVDYMDGANREFGKGLREAFSGSIFETQEKLAGMSNGLRGLAGELERVAALVLNGAAGIQQHGAAAGQASVNQQKLNEQLKAYGELWRELGGRMANERQAALLKYQEDVAKINQLTELSAEQRRLIWLRALAAYWQKIGEIEQKERDQELEHQAQLAQIERDSQQERAKRWLKFWSDIYGAQIKAQLDAEKEQREAAEKAIQAADAIQRALELARQGRIRPNVAASAQTYAGDLQRTMEQRLRELQSRPNLNVEEINEVVRLQTAIEKLSRANLKPLVRQLVELLEEMRRIDGTRFSSLEIMLREMSKRAMDFVAEAGTAFATFFADLVSGQEGAGKQLLAAFLNIIGKMLVQIGVILIQAGIAEIALAHTLIGRMMGASVAAGVKALAVGALLTVAGGVMMGAATALTQSSQASSASSQQEVTQASSTSNQVQVISVGAPRGAQNPGQASATQTQPEKAVVEIRPPEGWVVKEVVREYKSNNKQLRLVLNNA